MALRHSVSKLEGKPAIGDLIPDNPLGREMMVRQAARQFYRLGEDHNLVYGRQANGENGHKLTVSTRIGSESRLMDYLG